MPVKLADGRALPSIGFGTYLTPPSETCGEVYGALKEGYRLIDSAAVYSNEEEATEGIVKFLKENKNVKREDIIYTSKLWQDDFGSKAAKGVAESVGAAAEIGVIDLFLMHSPRGSKEVRRQTWAVLEKAVENGKIVSIGVSDWDIEHLQELLEAPDLKIKPLVNQIKITPCLQHNDIIEYCQQHGIAVEVYCPLRDGDCLDDPKIAKLAQKYNEMSSKNCVILHR